MKQWKKYMIAAGIPIIILVVILIIQNSVSKKDTVVDKSSDPVSESIQAKADRKDNTKEMKNSKESSTTDEVKNILSAKVDTSDENKTVSEVKAKSEEEIQTDIDEFINTYFKNSTNEIIEEYRNIKNYVKPGLDADGYVIFTTYDIKVFNIDTLVPGMRSLYVVQDDSGSFVIKDSTDNDKITNYIKKLTEEKEIKKLVKEVNSKLEAAIKKDNSLKVFIDYLK